jgi:hypothetical protein
MEPSGLIWGGRSVELISDPTDLPPQIAVIDDVVGLLTQSTA